MKILLRTPTDGYYPSLWRHECSNILYISVQLKQFEVIWGLRTGEQIGADYS